MFNYPENNTDDEQEDLPYDGDLQNTYQHVCDSENLKNLTSVENDPQYFFNLTFPQISNNSKEKSDYKEELPQRKINLASSPMENDMEFTRATEKEITFGDVSISGRNQLFSSSNFSDVLLRHFPNEEFSSLSQLIDSETIPEISFTDSFDETILNKIKNSESTSLLEEKITHFEYYNSGREEKCKSIEKKWDLIEGEQCEINESVNLRYDRKDCKGDNQPFVTQKESAANEELNYFSNPKEECNEQKYVLEMTGSSQQLKHGHRQIHYRLPDFSKVAPRVKIPKGNANTATPVMKKTKSSPNLLDKSTIVRDVLEAMNSLESLTVKDQEEEIRIPELDLQLELLMKQAEAQNRIDHLRFNGKLLSYSNSRSSNSGIKTQGSGVTSEMSMVPPITVPVKPMLSFSQSPFSDSKSQKMVSPLPSAGAERHSSVNPPPPQKATEGEKISQMLREQTEELKIKVEKVSKSMAQVVSPVQECHQMLLLKEQLGQLEQNYLAMKEKHRGLQLQNYKHSSTSIGEFDPDRKVEGEIFKLEMLLEDMKEKIDKRCSPHTSPLVTSPSLTPCESLCSLYSSCAESPLISSINEPPPKIAARVNIFKNKKYGENKHNPIGVIPHGKSQQPNQAGSHPFHQDQSEFKKRNACEKIIAEPLEKSNLLTYPQYVPHCIFSPNKKAGELLSLRELETNQNCNGDQENIEGNLNYWEMRSLPPDNVGLNTANLTVLKEKGNSAYSSDCCFLEELENTAEQHNIIIHPRLKIQLSSKASTHICTCSSSRTKNTEYRKMNRGKSGCERFSVFLEGKTMDLDLSGTEDSSFSDVIGNSSSKEFLEQRTKCHASQREDLKEQNKVSLQKKNVAFQRVSNTKNHPEQWIDRLSDRQNLQVPQTRCSKMYDTIILSPQYLTSSNIHGRRSLSNLRNRHSKDTDTKILNSTLDHVIQTANNLKKTTEHMIQVVSEDLAKAKSQTFSSAAASQDYI